MYPDDERVVTAHKISTEAKVIAWEEDGELGISAQEEDFLPGIWRNLLSVKHNICQLGCFAYQLYGYNYYDDDEIDLSQLDDSGSGFLIGPDIFITSYRFSGQCAKVFCSNSIFPTTTRINRNTHIELSAIRATPDVVLDDNNKDPISGIEIVYGNIEFMQVTRSIAARSGAPRASLHYLIPTAKSILPGMEVGVIGYSPLDYINRHIRFYYHDVTPEHSTELADAICDSFFKNQKMISLGKVLEANSIAAADYSNCYRNGW
jgi:hypothetical protein